MPATRKEAERKKKRRVVDGRPSGPAPGPSSKRTGHPPAPAPPKTKPPQNGTTSKSTGTPSGPESEDKPANWPTEVQYLSQACIPSPNLPPYLTHTFCSPFPYHPLPLSHLSIRPITPHTPFRPHPLLQNTSHPALGQHGLFAEVELPARRLVCAYLGVVHGEEETDAGSEYDAQVWARGEGGEGEGDVGLGIDATFAGNLGRFINDFRGIAQRANVTFEDWPSSASSEGGEGNQPRGLALYTGPAGVAAGAELCVSYGKAFWEARGVLPTTGTGTASGPP